ncbi:hybrid sensor histidine kinase/response regulator transcription factor [Bacteroides sp. 519]|uniref:hybrid sensor histidine kinase/response regulator transcription factor n=1 Tax=Bacteroides sp. 519 TaxID=2302937 RepID=UPI0013D896B3|nr:hybrid sensor histidine kinase/response regulator transcription factor [Bacteroides sp. 519]NDV59060.1 hybrid sensor histidine kinase/response regulator [Bacteroides sp. 519]
MKTRYIFYFFLAFLFLTQQAWGAENYKFRTMSPDGGFYYDGIKAIEQDKDGFVWIMMDYELYRFDGLEYKKYYPHFAAINDSCKWLFRNMASDAQGNLFVNTDNGVFGYNRIYDKFEWIFDRVYVIKTDKLNNLWAWHEQKWRLVDVINKTLTEPLFDGDSVSYVNPTICTHNNDLYTFINNKVYRYNPAKHEFVFCMALPQSDSNIRFAKAHQGKLWLYNNKYGLYKIDLSTFRVEEQYGLIDEVSSSSIRTFLIDREGYLWLGTINGLYILDPQTRTCSHYTHSDTDPFSLPNNSIWTINEDRQGNIWVGTYSGKLCYVNINESNAFKTFTPQNSGLNQVPVSSFAESEKHIWIGTEGGGINRMDKETNQFQYFTQDNNITSNNIKSMVVYPNENLWISMYTGGLDHYDRSQNTVTNYKNKRETSNSLLINNIRKTVQEADSGLWIAYQYQKPEISYFSIKANTFKHIKLKKDTDEYIFDILKQGEKYLWAITNETLYRMDIATHKVETMIAKNYMGFFTFCLDDSGNIWIGTIGNGLIKFDPNNTTFVALHELLPNNIYSIYNICYDDGNIWMGTDNGLYCYNIAQNSLQKFDKREGTQGQVYYPLAVMKGNNGKLYFGGTNGFTVVNPKKLPYNQYKPKVIISDFFIDHKSAQPTYAFKDSVTEIVLKYDQANFGFKFSSDNYHVPEKNTFRYRLKGYDERWIETTAANRTAMYSKVPAGTYYFEVYTANNDGVWGNTPVTIKIKRKPAPWVSWPAYLLYCLVVISIVYIILRHYNEKKRLKMQLYLENIENDKKEQIHQTQLRFFTNISHDFRTPLSLIIAALEKLRKEGLKEYYYRILNGNAQRLLNLVNELMDFRTVENGKMKLELQSININNLINEIATDFADYAAQRNIDFRIACNPNLPNDIYVDRNILEKVVMNLLNNAFKYSRDNGNITIETGFGNNNFVSRYKSSHTIGEVTNYAETFHIAVKDTGVGISKESISSVFERFYKVNTVNSDSHLGTGIGLALVKSFVLLHKGSISLYSERNEGTDIIVYLPLNKEVFNEEDFMQSKEVKVEKEEPAEDNAPYTPAGNEENKILKQLKKKILIAEDNEDLRVLIAESLSDEFDIYQAPDGLAATKLIAKVDFELIVSDIMMPHKDGVSLCNDVKTDINTSHIPFILLTAKTSVESKIEGVGSGADLYLEKPIDLNFLKLSIQNIFRNQQQLKEYYAKNYYADSSELSSNEQDNKFLKKLTAFIEANLDQSEMDVNLIANELSMSRSKLYTKVKGLTGKSVVEFVLNYRLRKAAKLIIEENITMKEVMMQIGIESQPYFTNAFKKMFGETPTAFAAKHKAK